MDATSDDLTKPLGTERQPGNARSWSKKAKIAGGVGLPILALALAGLVGILVLRRPAPPEPFAVAPIRIREAAGPMPVPTETAQPTPGEAEGGAAQPPTETATQPMLIRVPDGSGKLAAAPDPRLVERTRYGLLPKIGPDGARPSQVYGRPTVLKAGPKIALVLGGLGIGQSATAEAIAKLPPAVTLAFAPYGADLDQVVARARDDGHEVMLQVPMEPFDYPDNDPGPHTLTVRAKPQENIERLHWVMGRFTGYTGILTFMGAKLTADETALAPILREIAGRGLLVVDDGSSVRSSIRPGPTSFKAQMVLDATPRADAIDRELQRLEDSAREQGLAIGTASALPLTIDRVSRWAKSLEERGLQLVPLSALAEGRR